MQGEARRDHVGLRFRSHPRLLCVARSAVRRYAELAGFPARTVEDVVLAVDESLTNVIRHCYAGRECEPIELDLWMDEPPTERLMIRIRDRGPAIPPESLRPPREPAPEEPGGLGLRLIHDVMDSVSHRVASEEEGGGNVLVLGIDRPSAATESP